VVTGGSSGLGFETALALARAGADVILAGRDGKAAIESISALRQLVPGVLVRFEMLDLANLQSVADFAARLTARKQPIDLLVHCAVVAESEQRRVTLDGFEMQLGVHFLGPFALTARLLPILRRSRKPRIVQLGSMAHGKGMIRFDNLQLVRVYEAHLAHFQSKLAALMFGMELQRRSDARGWRLVSVVADPAHSNGSELAPSTGALPVLFAATSTTVRPGGFYGPADGLEVAGPGLLQVDEKAQCRAAAGRLWELGEQLTGFYWPDA
jgi:NAD(P)-dependent dehydrogenase (short-subunit alcohol dehydrogenase family)